MPLEQSPSAPGHSWTPFISLEAPHRAGLWMSFAAQTAADCRQTVGRKEERHSLSLSKTLGKALSAVKHGKEVQSNASECVSKLPSLQPKSFSKEKNHSISIQFQFNRHE